MKSITLTKIDGTNNYYDISKKDACLICRANKIKTSYSFKYVLLPNERHAFIYSVNAADGIFYKLYFDYNSDPTLKKINNKIFVCEGDGLDFYLKIKWKC